MTVRQLRESDIGSFVELASQLGYAAEPEYVTKRLSEDDPGEIVLVAADGDRILGWVDCRLARSYLVDSHCEIAGLVVREGERGRGIGASLVRSAEEWAREQGVGKMLVRSNVLRDRAHKFYLDNGYSVAKQSMVFRKAI